MISLVEDHICPRFSRLFSEAKEVFSVLVNVPLR